MRALEPHDPRSAGAYRILARLGGGGMATVFFGRSMSGRPAAVKLMHAEFAAREDYRERFRREVTNTRAAGGQYSPGVLDADPDAEIPWLALEFLPSVSLRDAVRQLGALPAGTVRMIAASLAEALVSIHRAGIVHLDLKPANVLLTADGPRLIDFGIAIRAQSGAGVTSAIPAGSRGFMSPEQLAGAGIGPASDVYSFGATLAYACTGATPPAAEHTRATTSASEHTRIADETLRTLIANCLRLEPAERPTVSELIDILAAHGEDLADPPPRLMALVDRQAGEAGNPPLPSPAGPAAPARRGLDRRAVLLSGAFVIVVAGAATVATLIWRQPQPGAAPGPVTPGRAAGNAPPARTPSATPVPRTLEFYIFGRTTLKSLTTTVNGQAVTVTNVPLPYQRTVRIPRWPHRSTWRIDYRFGAGVLVWTVSVDGAEYDTGSNSSTYDDNETYHQHGTVDFPGALPNPSG